MTIIKTNATICPKNANLMMLWEIMLKCPLLQRLASLEVDLVAKLAQGTLVLLVVTHDEEHYLN